MPARLRKKILLRSIPLLAFVAAYQAVENVSITESLSGTPTTRVTQMTIEIVTTKTTITAYGNPTRTTNVAPVSAADLSVAASPADLSTSLSTVTSTSTLPTLSSSGRSTTSAPDTTNAPTAIGFPSPDDGPTTRSEALVQTCYDMPGGDQTTGQLGIGCGTFLTQVMNCYNQGAPWSDPYNTSQSQAFQACVCGTDAQNPFNVNSSLWQNFLGCANCLLEYKQPSQSYIDLEEQMIVNFCHSQDPVAFLFVGNLTLWFRQLHDGGRLTAPAFTGMITQLSTLSSVFPYSPPLANLAWGASAPVNGSLAGLTPSLATFTTTVGNGAAMLTTSVSWMPIGSGGGRHGETTPPAATASVAQVPTTATESNRCMGRGPCYGSGQGGRPDSIPSMALSIILMIVLAGLAFVWH